MVLKQHNSISFLIFSYVVFSLFALVYNIYGLPSIHYIVLIFLFFYSFFIKNFFLSRFSKSFLILIIVASIFSLITYVFEIDVFLNDILVHFSLYFLFPFYALLLKDNFDSVSPKVIDRLIFVIVLFVGFSGIIQKFIDPQLFGLYSYNRYYLDNFDLRIGGLVASPQVFGLLLSICACYLFDRFRDEKIYLYLLLCLFSVFCSFLSGNKSVLAVIFVYLMFGLKIRYFFMGILILATLTISMFVFFPGAFENRAFSLFLNLDRVLADERAGRISIYLNRFTEVFDSFQLLSGKGIGYYGSASRINFSDRSVESAFLVILYELGIFIFLFYLFMIYRAVYIKEINYRGTNLAFISSMIYVHAALSPLFLPFWILLFNRTK